MLRKIVFILVLICIAGIVFSQTQNGFVKHGTVSEASCSNVSIAGVPNPIDHMLYINGSAWYRNQIDLDSAFELGMVISIYKTIATDGMAFVLCADSGALGKKEHYMGWGGMKESFAVTFDTKSEALDNDPPYTHLAIQTNGVTDHAITANNIAGPVPFEQSIDEGLISKYVVFKWNPVTKIFTVVSGSTVLLSVQYDIAANIFNGQRKVHWGFTGSQTQLTDMSNIPPDSRPPLGFLKAYFGLITPDFYSSPVLDTCFGGPISFFDNSLYLSNSVFNSRDLAHWFWDFGDGSTSILRIPPPHQYAAAGQYELRFAVTNQIGCTLDTLVKKITLASTPVANFDHSPACSGVNVLFTDRSAATVTNGIFNFQWNFNNESTSTEKDPVIVFNSPGIKTISLKVRTAEGCTGQVSKTISFSPSPSIDFSFAKDCNRTLSYNGILLNAIAVNSWIWDFGDGRTGSGNNTRHQFAANETYHHALYAVSHAGCVSDTIYKDIPVNKIIPNAGADTVAVENLPMQLTASGADRYKWEPAVGLNNASISNPVAILPAGQQRYFVEFTNNDGCKAYDTIIIKIFNHPDLFVASAFSPNGDGRNDLLHVTAPGFKRISYFKIFNRSGNEVFSSTLYGAAWDGNFKGEPSPAGTYVWIISGEDDKGKIMSKKGTVLLLR